MMLDDRLRVGNGWSHLVYPLLQAGRRPDKGHTTRSTAPPVRPSVRPPSVRPTPNPTNMDMMAVFKMLATSNETSFKHLIDSNLQLARACGANNADALVMFQQGLSN